MIEELTVEIRRSEKEAYEKIIRAMAHEVNNSIGAANSLLHSCLNYKEQIRENDRADYVNAHSMVISRADHLNRFIKSYADVVRLPKPNLQSCDISGLTEGITGLLALKMKERNISVEIKSPGPLTVRLDRNQMEQALVNILKNAAEAIESAGTIRISAGNQDKRRFLKIEDTGAGISDEDINNIFTPYYSTKEDGTGIGLTLVQEILNDHGFEFSLSSEPGAGTRFTIWFD